METAFVMFFGVCGRYPQCRVSIQLMIFGVLQDIRRELGISEWKNTGRRWATKGF